MPDHTPLTDQQMAEFEAIAARATTTPFFLSDCEGSLQVWHESELVRVTRDEHGEITGYSFPFAYPPAAQVLELDLDSWDPGEDATDDQRRQDINDLVDSRAAMGVLVAEIRRLRLERDLAVAHDRQPYPTAWAYEQACKALHQKTDAIDQVRAMHRKRTERHGSGCVQCGIVWPCPTYKALDVPGPTIPDHTVNEEQGPEDEPAADTSKETEA